jgi:hypothetical protein
MKRTHTYFHASIILFTGVLAFSKIKNVKMKPADTGFALIELFTSEGCSSCPPADDAVADIQKQYADKNLLVLSYHVDYWDRLGWKDPFSSPAYTERQSYYAGIFNLESIYTPQVVVNGKEEFVGSNKNKLIHTVDEELKENSASLITLKATQNNTGKVEITYSIDVNNSKQDELVLLLVQKMATIHIKKGENEGRTLHHINIVRENSVMPATSKEETKTFKLPPGLKKEEVFVAAFLQDKKTGKITGMQSSNVK